MKPKISLKELKKDFSFLEKDLKENKILAVLLYGSYVKKQQHIRSDVDICVVAPKFKTIKEQADLLSYLWRNINANKYDVRLFEELPLYIKASVIKNHKVILIANEFEFRYYFYFVNKIWKDQSVNWIYKKL